MQKQTLQKILQNHIILNLKLNIGGFNHQREFQQLAWNIAQIQGNKGNSVFVESIKIFIVKFVIFIFYYQVSFERKFTTFSLRKDCHHIFLVNVDGTLAMFWFSCPVFFPRTTYLFYSSYFYTLFESDFHFSCLYFIAFYF